MADYLFWFAVGVAWRVPVWIAALSLAEYLGHRYWLHGRWKWLRENVATARRDFLEHHVEHHGHDQNEIRPHIHLSPAMYAPVVPFLIVNGIAAASGSPSGAAGVVVILAACVFHYECWNAMHRAIHGLDEANWSTRLPWYSAVERHHLAHHANLRRHFGIVFPWW